MEEYIGNKARAEIWILLWAKLWELSQKPGQGPKRSVFWTGVTGGRGN
jgi:hypothetical protein